MLTDIEIAQRATLRPIVEIAGRAGLSEDDLELLSAVAQFTAVHIDNCKSYRKRQEYNQQLFHLGRATQRLSSFLNREQILKELRGAGFVATDRGKFGGYRLAMPAEKIVVGTAIRTLEGPLAPIGCVSQSAYCRCSCPDEDHCGLRMIMMDVRNAIAGILDRYTLAHVVEVTLRKMRRDGVPLPFSSPAAFPFRRHPSTADANDVIANMVEDYSI